jgi:ribosomal-protein-alanine N-acetyltransferase
VTHPTVARAEHAALLAAIHASAFPEHARWDEAAMLALLRMPGAFALVDPDGAFVLARTAADEAEILTLAVAPPLRRQGRARTLLRAAVAHCADGGVAALFLEVAAGNHAARALYEAEGFAPVGCRAGYYADGADALLLRRAVDQSDRARQDAAA